MAAENGDNAGLQRIFRPLRYPFRSLEAIRQASKDELLSKYECGCTPLRHAVIFGGSIEHVTLLIDRAPEALTLPSIKGNMILSSLQRNTLPEIAMLVAECTPTSSFLHRNDDGDLPLHCLIQRNVPSQILKLVIRRSPPHAFVTANKLGRLPIHDATRAGVSLDVLQLLLEHAPTTQNSLGMRDKDRRMPLHSLSSTTSKEVTDFLISSSPRRTLLVPDKYGWLPLHCAIGERTSLAAVESLIEHYPVAVLEATDNSQRTPLHLFTGRMTRDVAQRLIDRSPPDALIQRDYYGRLPIHCAIENDPRHVVADVLELLIEKAPRDCLSMTDNGRRTPVHSAILTRCNNIDAISLLVNRSPRSVFFSMDKQGRVPLECAIERNASPEVVQLLVNKTPHGITCRSCEFGHGKTLLHRLESSTPAEVLSILDEAAPELLTTADHNGRLPIHYAVRSWPHELAQELVDRCPQSLLVADRDGRLALHYVSPSTSADVVFCLMSHPSSEEALLTPDKKGRCPLHCAILEEASVEIIKLLVNGAPIAALLHSDKRGRRPLYHAISHKFGRRERRTDWVLSVVKLIVERSPELLATRGKRERLPLHDAAVVGADLSVVEYLVRAYPEAAKQTDKDGRLPVHLALKNGLPFESIQTLLNPFVGAVRCSDKRGRTPLQIASETNASLNTLYTLIRQAPDLLCHLNLD